MLSPDLVDCDSHPAKQKILGTAVQVVSLPAGSVYLHDALNLRHAQLDIFCQPAIHVAYSVVKIWSRCRTACEPVAFHTVPWAREPPRQHPADACLAVQACGGASVSARTSWPVSKRKRTSIS